MGQETDELISFVAEFARSLEQRVSVESIVLFGSRARGDAQQDSDIDLLVVSPDFGRNPLDDLVLLRECLPAHEVDVDPIARTPAEISSADPESFLFTILRDGKTLYPAACVS